jgi:TonB family protein
LPDVSPGAGEMVSIAQGSEGLILPKQNRPRFARYSYGALISRVEGDVTLELTLDEGGNVVDARAVSGPVELRQEAVRWALDWRYDPNVQSARNVVATVSFRLPPEDPHVSFPLLALPGLLDSADFPPASLVLRSVQTADLDPPNPALQARLESYIGRSLADAGVADAIHADIVNATEGGSGYYATRAYTAPRADGAVLLVRRPLAVERTPTENVPVVRTEAPPVPKRIRIDGAVQKEKLLRQVRPEYPALARQARVQGTVELSVILTHEGAVQTVEVLSGQPLLISAAIDAVKQWRYKPTLLNGVPVEVETQVSVNFYIEP